MTHGHPDSLGVTAGTAADTFVLPYNDFGAAQNLFEKHGKEIAAIIVEPFLGNVGFIMPERGFLAHLRKLTSAHGALLIFDEVMTGFRISLQGTMGLHDVRPDLVCLGKIIGGGLPVGAFGGRADIMDCVAPLGGVYQAGTFCGNPIALAAGIAALEKILREKDLYAKLSNFGETLANALEKSARERKIAIQVPHAGGMFSIFFSEKPVRSFSDIAGCDTDKTVKFFRAALARGIFLPPSPYESCFISAAHDASALEKTTQGLCDALAEI